MVCGEGDRTVVSVKPPLTYVILNMSCQAFAAEITLPPYYHRESKFTVRNIKESLFRSENIRFQDIWEPLKEILPEGEPRNELETFGDVAEIPLSKLKERLEAIRNNGIDQPLGGHKKASKALAGIVGVVLLVI